MDSKRRSRSPIEYKEDHDKDYESSGKKDNSRDLEELSNARPARGHEFVRHADRHSYGSSRESKRHDDYKRQHDKHADDYGRSHPRASRSDRESRADTYYDRSKRDSRGRSRGDQRDVDSRYGEKSVNREQSNNKEITKEEEAMKKRNGKEIEKEAEVQTREKKRSLFSSAGPNVDCSGANDALDSSGGSLDAVNAAKVAAMKAAELVNRNIATLGVGTGRLSTDQKKKLLWGNKKSNPPEEASTRWDQNLFSDRERQEKFNKLMGVKSSAPVQENKVDNKVGGSAEAKKLEDLDTDLEKHYIAGLRRRDGRTVGLGL